MRGNLDHEHGTCPTCGQQVVIAAYDEATLVHDLIEKCKLAGWNGHTEGLPERPHSLWVVGMIERCANRYMVTRSKEQRIALLALAAYLHALFVRS